ncbi:hypothetical protein [Humibacter sp. RRB41]|uniref:hypothetical protein n=1 Tax=Humibacter sp. RRB41 TaxID=2919946 RepID=UPI001FAAD04A|nr:hypothetical protein [Humibacter sp. RRB41]
MGATEVSTVFVHGSHRDSGGHRPRHTGGARLGAGVSSALTAGSLTLAMGLVLSLVLLVPATGRDHTAVPTGSDVLSTETGAAPTH